MSKDQYLEMCEQTGEEIDWERCPPDLEDFPSVVVDFLNIYYSLGNRVYPDIGYVGKDYTTLPFLMKIYKIESHLEDYLMETLLLLDSKAIEDSQKKIKAEMDKATSKSKSKIP